MELEDLLDKKNNIQFKTKKNIKNYRKNIVKTSLLVGVSFLMGIFVTITMSSQININNHFQDGYADLKKEEIKKDIIKLTKSENYLNEFLKRTIKDEKTRKELHNEIIKLNLKTEVNELYLMLENDVMLSEAEYDNLLTEKNIKLKNDLNNIASLVGMTGGENVLTDKQIKKVLINSDLNQKNIMGILPIQVWFLLDKKLSEENMWYLLKNTNLNYKNNKELSVYIEGEFVLETALKAENISNKNNKLTNEQWKYLLENTKLENIKDEESLYKLEKLKKTLY